MSKRLKPYEIRTPNGEHIVNHVRVELPTGKRFFFERPDGKHGLGEISLTALPLYGSEDVGGWAADEPVILVEGEKARDALGSAGFKAVASVTGASTCPGPLPLAVLKDRIVVLWPDADKPGLSHMAKIGLALEGIAREVRLFTWPEAPEKADAFDFLMLGDGQAAALKLALDETPSAMEWAYEHVRESAREADAREDAPASDGGSGRCSPGRTAWMASRMIQLMEDASLFHTSANEPYASVEIGSRRETLRLDSDRFEHFLRERYFEQEAGTASKKAIEEAVHQLTSFALFRSPCEEVFIRSARHDGKIYLDLCDSDWRVVEIGPDGWQVIDRSPVKFQRRSYMAAMPEPKRGGNIKLLRPFVNVSCDEDWVLLVTWITASLLPEGPYPILALLGEQGSSKSTLAKVLRMLIDPNASPLRSEPQSVQDLAVSAAASWLQVYDNVSRLTPAIADAICRIATGGAFAARRLYTDGEEFVINLARPVLLNGIEDIVTRGDMLDRTVVLSLPGIEDDARRAESEFWEAFSIAQPLILGALFDAISTALRVRHKVKLDRMPRMADFALWGAAVADALGWAPAMFEQSYSCNRTAAHFIVLEGSAVAAAVRGWTAEVGAWEGTATALMAELNPRRAGGADAGPDFPTSPQKLANDLRRLVPHLSAVGVQVKWPSRSAKSRNIRIRRVPIPASLELAVASESRADEPFVAGRTAADGRPDAIAATHDGRAEDDTCDARDAAAGTIPLRERSDESPADNPAEPRGQS